MLIIAYLLFVDTYVNIYVDTERRVIAITKMGRPTDDPKILNTRIRLSQSDVEMLNYCAEITGFNKSEIIRIGIKEVYKKLKEE